MIDEAKSEYGHGEELRVRCADPINRQISVTMFCDGINRWSKTLKPYMCDCKSENVDSLHNANATTFCSE